MMTYQVKWLLKTKWKEDRVSETHTLSSLQQTQSRPFLLQHLLCSPEEAVCLDWKDIGYEKYISQHSVEAEIDDGNTRSISLKSWYKRELLGIRWTCSCLYVISYAFKATPSHLFSAQGNSFFVDELLPYSLCSRRGLPWFYAGSLASPVWTNRFTFLRYFKCQRTERVIQPPSCGQSKKCESYFFISLPETASGEKNNNNNNKVEMQTDWAVRLRGRLWGGPLPPPIPDVPETQLGPCFCPCLLCNSAVIV